MHANKQSTKAGARLLLKELQRAVDITVDTEWHVNHRNLRTLHHADWTFARSGNQPGTYNRKAVLGSGRAGQLTEKLAASYG